MNLHEVRNREYNRTDSCDHNSFANPLRNVSISTKITDEYDCQQISQLESADYQSGHTAWEVKPFLDCGYDTTDNIID